MKKLNENMIEDEITFHEDDKSKFQEKKTKDFKYGNSVIEKEARSPNSFKLGPVSLN